VGQFVFVFHGTPPVVNFRAAQCLIRVYGGFAVTIPRPCSPASDS
jgi:hypothetical protein